MKPEEHPGIRKACAEDMDCILQIEQKAFPGPTAYSKRQLEYLVQNSRSTSLVESHKDVIRGFIIVTYRRGSLTGNIETVDVDPAFHGWGIGLKLLLAAEDDMKQRGMQCSQLEVSEGNKPAIKLYMKAGYSIKEKLKEYYRHEHQGTRDAIRMIKNL